MRPHERGEFAFPERARQLISWAGAAWGQITVGDIDGFVEFSGRLFVLIELKYLSASPPSGQNTAFLRWQEQSRVSTLYITASHNVYDPTDDVDGLNTPVTGYRFCEPGHRPNVCVPDTQLTVRELIDTYLVLLGLWRKDFGPAPEPSASVWRGIR